MEISHPAISSPIFRLLEVYEFDIRLGDDGWSVRIELFQDVAGSNRFRARVSERELFRLRPTFPQDAAGNPEHTSDDAVLVERPLSHGTTPYPDFEAADRDEAIALVRQDVIGFLANAATHPRME